MLTRPAVLAMVAYLVLAFAILLPLDGFQSCRTNDPTCYNFEKRLMTVVLMLIPIGLSIYSIQCMMVGKCVLWSWVNSIFIAVWVLLFLIAIVMSSEKRVTHHQQHRIVVVNYDSLKN